MIETVQLIGGPRDGDLQDIRGGIDQFIHIDPPCIVATARGSLPPLPEMLTTHLIRQGLYRRRPDDDPGPDRDKRFDWQGWLDPIGGESNHPHGG